METQAKQYENKLIVLKALNNEIEDSLKERKKWVTVVDVEGNAEIYFKYQGTSYFSILEKEVAPENLCRSLLTMVKYPRTLTINYLDLPYQNIFDETYFPQAVLDHAWISDYKNIEKLRQHFLQEFPEEIFPCPDFKLCFIFRKDNVPEILHQKTDVLEICSPDEIEEKQAEQKAREEAKKPVVEEKKETKAEETKTDAKTISSTAKKTTAGTTASKTTPSKTATTTTQAKTTSTTTKAPVKSTSSTTGSGSKSSTTSKPSVPTKTAVKK